MFRILTFARRTRDRWQYTTGWVAAWLAITCGLVAAEYAGGPIVAIVAIVAVFGVAVTVAVLRGRRL